MIYRFRIILDAKDDIFRDVELESNSTFEDLHNTIIQSFGMSGHEMATFYITDEEWNQGEAITLTDMFEEPSKLMHQTALYDVFTDDQKTALYVYDFLNMWTFFVTCVEEAESIAGVSYPQLVFSHGVVPDQAPLKTFEQSEEVQSENDQEGWEDESYQDDQLY